MKQNLAKAFAGGFRARIFGLKPYWFKYGNHDWAKKYNEAFDKGWIHAEHLINP